MRVEEIRRHQENLAIGRDCNEGSEVRRSGGGEGRGEEGGGKGGGNEKGREGGRERREKREEGRERRGNTHV
eukprot:10309644-Prorocentrum_lima.AAC.1